MVTSEQEGKLNGCQEESGGEDGLGKARRWERVGELWEQRARGGVCEEKRMEMGSKLGGQPARDSRQW